MPGPVGYVVIGVVAIATVAAGFAFHEVRSVHKGAAAIRLT